MTVVLPNALIDPDDDTALELLHRNYGSDDRGLPPAGGAAFDTWDSTGTRDRDRDRFTADDLTAVTFLSVDVPARAARLLLVDERDRFSGLLAELGPDRDLASIEEPLPGEWVGWDLMRALRRLPGVGPTRASKLLARKRPRLRPIWDSVVAEVTGTPPAVGAFRAALRADDVALQRRLLRLRDEAGLDDRIGALRVLDVITWLEGKDRGL